jgi:hypothetical protein
MCDNGHYHTCLASIAMRHASWATADMKAHGELDLCVFHSSDHFVTGVTLRKGEVVIVVLVVSTMVPVFA